MKANVTDITLHQQSKVLEVSFDTDETFELSCEFLRVFSPSAEVRGHGPGQEVLQLGKEDVNIESIEPVGSYGIKPMFSDGHNTGIFSWDTLYEYGRERDSMWQQYLKDVAAAGHKRKG